MENGDIIDKKYKIDGPLSAGTFGQIYNAHNIKTKEKVAVKTENPEYQDELSTLRHEAKMIQFLYTKHVRKITEIYWYGVLNNKIFMVMALYDRSLADCIPRILAKTPEEKARTIGGIVVQVLNILRNIHEYYVVHRDIKPQNFMLRGNNIYMIDFGLATFYLDNNGQHYDYDAAPSKTITGSPKYASIYSHRGIRYCRRDDVIALCYMAIYLENGNAPWDQGLENLPESAEIAAEINQRRLEAKSHIEDYTANPTLKSFLYDNMQVGFYQRPKYENYTVS
jgi:serine/threonine protein kinase